MRSFVVPVTLFFSLVLAACGGPAPAGFEGAPAGSACASGLVWKGEESAEMNPGMACRACHLGQNFAGQNPTGQREPKRAFFFMGTAYAAAHEIDSCRSANVPAGAVVEILDANDVVQATLPINAAGNFYSASTTAGFTLPYKARVVANGKTNAMASPQMEGDCNTCHTAQGSGGAPGRIMWLP